MSDGRDERCDDLIDLAAVRAAGPRATAARPMTPAAATGAPSARLQRALDLPAARPLDEARFLERLSHDLDLVRRTGTRLAVHLLDLAGSEAAGGRLEPMLQRLQDALQPGDALALLGPDELAVLQMPAGDVFALHRLASRLVQACAPKRRSGRPTGGGPSLGIAVYPTDGVRAALLLARARQAAARARQWGGHGFCFHHLGLGRELAQGLAMDHDLRGAARRGAIGLAFAPALDPRRDRIAAATAELAWRHPEIGALTAEAFQPAAERTGLVGALSRQAIRQACASLAPWRRQGLIDTISLRCGGAPLGQPHFATMAREVLLGLDLPGDGLILAIDPDPALDPADRCLRANLNRLAELGVRAAWRIAAGQPLALAALAALPISRLQLGPCLLAQCGPRGARLLTALIELGLGLGLEVWAEGVTSDAELRLLAAAGCTIVAGPLIGPPLAAADFARFAAQARLRPAAPRPPAGPPPLH
jgi:predicted signal transduction protein with EAL and GGDEF domain